MPVKFYYVLAFPEGVTPLWNPSAQPHFLGKTSNLSFKTEPDKTIDLDDGSTEVGSEKLSLSFSILGAIQNPWSLREIWLVPAISDGTYPLGEFPPGDVLRIYLRDADDYHIETKSGEFELNHFSANIRYAAEAPAYDYIEDFFEHWRIHLFPNVSKFIDEGLSVSDSDLSTLAELAGSYTWLVPNQAALVSPVVLGDVRVIVDGDIIQEIDPNQKGIFILRI